MNTTKLALTVACSLVMTVAAMAQPDNWFNLDYAKDGVRGVSSEKVYEELVKDKKSETVIVAVIDSGVDEEHEDLQAIMWVNEDEIPGNGIDDDKNGYVDDINGWNFLGGKDGRNVNNESLEVTRIYASLKKKYGDRTDAKGLSKKKRKEFALYQKVKKEVEESRTKAVENVATTKEKVTMYEQAFARAKELLAGKELNAASLKTISESAGPKDQTAIKVMETVVDRETTLEKYEAYIQKRLPRVINYYQNQAEFYYNTDFNPRKEIIGDNPNDVYEKGYGNNDVQGPDAGHGTHVAGIIGAIRDNDLGMKGVADNVRIMSVRAVPNGDENDKDVANAIIYAVDNGASIINMSFGKSYSANRVAVEKAIKYACKKDVLLVHAAGNAHQDNDQLDHFPHDDYSKRGWFSPKRAKNWLDVGALSWKDGADAPATFSNYGKTTVDVFAPGVAIYSTVPEKNQYDAKNGTSMAAPVAAGVAALLRSYFPKLTAVQVKNIIMETTVKLNGEVKTPGSGDLVPMKDLCITGGVVNAYRAFQLASKTKGKKKRKKGRK